MILQIGVHGFTSKRIWDLLPTKFPDKTRKALSRKSNSPEVSVGGLEKLSELLTGVTKIIYTPSPYLDEVPKLISILKERGYAGYLLFFSSGALYTSIPEHKRLWLQDAEEAGLKAGFKVGIIRPNLIYGYPGDRNFERIIGWMKKLPIIPLIGSGNNLIQPIHVDDLVDAVLEVVKQEKTGIIEIAGERPVMYKTFLQYLDKSLPGKRIIIPIPKSIVMFFMRQKRKIHYLDVLTSFVRNDQIERFTESRVLPNSQTPQLLGRPMISLQEGIQREVGMVIDQKKLLEVRS